MSGCVDESTLTFSLIGDFCNIIAWQRKLRCFDCECTNRLCNGTVFLRALVELRPKGVKQGCLAVVYMTHDRDHRRSPHEFVTVVTNEGHFLVK